MEIYMDRSSSSHEYMRQADSHVAAPVVEEDPESKKEGKSLAGGWKTMPFIMGSDICHALAGIGLGVNFFSYLNGQYHMGLVTAATFLSVWNGAGGFAPLLGAFLADAYLGRFCMLLVGSIFSLITCLLLCTSAALPSLRPAPGKQASAGQLLLLHAAFFCLVLSAAGIRPSAYAFGADQFKDRDTRSLQSYFNWYFWILYITILIGATVLVYIQDNRGWVWGFGVPTVAVFLSILALLMGYRRYRRVPPAGRGAFTSLAQVIYAAFCKRNLALPSDPTKLYGSAHDQASDIKAPPTRLTWLDHAAIPTNEDFNADGGIKNPWRLSTAREVGDLKALTRVVPIWMINVLWTSVLSQSGAFTIPQANTMERRLGSSSVRLPAASITLFSSLTFIVWMPVYDRLLVPLARRLTGHKRGIRLLQRIGVGFNLSLLSIVTSGLVETQRRRLARQAGLVNDPNAVVPMSVFWLAPQYCLEGLAGAFHGVGLLEFLYAEMPTSMRTMAGALYYTSTGIGQYIGTLILQLVHRFSGSSRTGHVDWLADNMNQGHIDYFYYLLAALELINFLIFLAVSWSMEVDSDHEYYVDLESRVQPAPDLSPVDEIKLSSSLQANLRRDLSPSDEIKLSPRDHAQGSHV